MANIILDSRKLMVYEDLKYLSDFSGKEEGFAESLWEGMLKYPELYEEFLFYVDNHSLKDKLKFKGYSLTDIYVNSIWEYNLALDIGKNTATCSKEAMILDTFMGMYQFMENPEKYEKGLNQGKGMDRI